MKVAVISSHTQSLFLYRMDMMQAFLQEGHEILAIGPDNELEWQNKFAEKGISYRSFPVQRNGINPLKDLKTLKTLTKIIQEERPQKVFAYQAKSIVYGSIATKMNKIEEFYPLFAGLGSIFRAESFKNKLIRIVMREQYKLACKNSKYIFFHNVDDKNEFLDQKVTQEDKTKVINGSGVNLDYFYPTIQPSTATFLFVGRLIKDKGIVEYLKACEIIKGKYPDVRCLLVGPFDSNPTALKPEELEPFLNKKTIEYFGEQEDVRPYVEQISTFVLPSYHEGTPKTILEAMAMKKSIITTDAPGCRETVKDNFNGYLVSVRSIEELVHAMEKLILNPSLSVEMGEMSLKIAREKYDVRIINKSIMEVMNLV